MYRPCWATILQTIPLHSGVKKHTQTAILRAFGSRVEQEKCKHNTELLFVLLFFCGVVAAWVSFRYATLTFLWNKRTAMSVMFSVFQNWWIMLAVSSVEIKSKKLAELNTIRRQSMRSELFPIAHKTWRKVLTVHLLDFNTENTLLWTSTVSLDSPYLKQLGSLLFISISINHFILSSIFFNHWDWNTVCFLFVFLNTFLYEEMFQYTSTIRSTQILISWRLQINCYPKVTQSTNTLCCSWSPRPTFAFYLSSFEKSLFECKVSS